MRFPIMVTLVAVVTAFGMPANTTSLAKGTSILIATPGEGHSGDVIYLSGTRFLPGTRPTITMACPNWRSPSISANNNLVYGTAGPVTDRHGSFAGFRFHALALRGIKSSACEIYASNGANVFGPDFPAAYTIISDDEPLPLCARSMCLSVEYRRPAGKDLLVIRGWPGAKGVIRISAKTYRRQYRLGFDWQGIALVPLDRASSLRSRIVHLDISARLGKSRGSYSGSIRLAP